MIKKYCFGLGLFILPFVFWPWAEIAYEIPKVWFFYGWVELLIILGLLGLPSWVKTKALSKKKSSALVIFTGIYVLLAILVSLLGVDLPKSIWGNYYRSDGLLTLFHFFGLFLFLNLYWEKSWQKPVIKTIFLSSLILIFWSLFLKFGFLVFNKALIPQNQGGSVFNKDIGGFFGNPNFLAGYLLVSLPFVFLFLKKTSLFFQIIIFLAYFLVILTTGSRAGILGAIIIFLSFVFFHLSQKKKVFFGLGLVFISLVFAFLFFKQNPQNIFENRQRIITRGWVGFIKKPLIGYGWANFDYAFKSNYWPIKYEQDIYVDKAHSSLLENLTTGGILLFSVYLFLLFKILRQLFLNRNQNSWQTALFLSFLLYLFHAQTNIISVNEEMFFWLIAGIISSET